MLPSFLLITAVSILYLRLIRTLDNRTPILWLTISLMWGGVSFALALMIQNGLVDGKLLNVTDVRLVSAPVLEELLKALPLLVLVHFGSRAQHGAVYGFAMGLGFALFESAIYIYANPDYALGTALARVISIHLIHGFTTGLIGLIASRKVALPQFALTIMAAMMVHAAFNLLALSLNGSLLMIAAAYAGITSVGVLSFLMSRRPVLVPAS
jgi:RsiW-degrading membrane proteinase PrsW (M82 family)